MNFILNLLSKIAGVVLNTGSTKNSQENTTVTRTENTNVVAEATAAILWICAVVLAIYWIPQYLIATYFFIRDSLISGHLVEFQLGVQSLFDMIYSLLGLTGAGVLHQIVKRLHK